MRKQHSASAALLLALCAGASAHIRLISDFNGVELFWASPSNISVAISASGSDNIADASHFTALRNAFDAWNDVTGTTAQLVENTSAVQQARTDWPADDIHLVFFDETNSSGFFGGSGAVAITWIEFFSNGVVADADVLFNGVDFAFTTSGQNSRFDIQDVATHELGHLLGLDHSGWAGATMYPYVDSFSAMTPDPILQRSLSLDEVRFLREAYPLGAFGSITGTVRRASNMNPVPGAHMTALDPAGATVAGALSDVNGNFTLFGLEPGTYSVNAEPLDFPVSSMNISASYTVQTNFEATQGTQVVVNTAAVSYGDLLVGADATVSLGRANNILPLRGIADGMARLYSLTGVGLAPGSTLTASNASVAISGEAWGGTTVTFFATVANGATPGHVDLTVQTVTSGRDVLPAAFEITPPDPVVTNIAPSLGDVAGGTMLTITGNNFVPGARVVIGGNVYEDGNGMTVVDENTIQLTTTASSGGTFDVVVMDSTGVEGRAVNAFEFIVEPMVTSVFPPAGNTGGGTEVTLRGANFLPGLTVAIDGQVQSNVTVVDANTLLIVTDPYLPGGPYLVEVQNPGGGQATTLFSFAVQADPVLGELDPAVGTTGGGTTVTITGMNFTAGTEVRFGADPLSGQGGTAATMVTWIDAQTLEVVTPTHAAGPAAVVVMEPTGQADMQTAAFTFAGGGGGGCYTVPVTGSGGSTWREVLAGTWWIAASLLAFAWLARRQRRIAPAG